MTIPTTKLCPLVADKKGLTDTDRECHVPRTQARFERTFPDTPCYGTTSDPSCQPCQNFPWYAAHEVCRVQLISIREVSGKKLLPV